MDAATRFGGLQEIGSGAFGVVYRAFDMQLSRYVALKKLIPRGNADDEQMLQDVQKEHALMAKLSHMNIVAVHDCLLEDGAAFIVLEWMPSGTVNDLIREHGRLHEVTVRKFSLDLLRGLQYLHEHGVIHHDIKPGNMLVNAEGTVKLSDFGTSKQVSQGSSGTTKNLTGTVRFMCPQGIENPKHTRATDIWALACSLTTMLSGQLPWADSIAPSADDMVPVIFHIGRRMPPNHHPTISDHVSQELRAILVRMFAFAPDERPSAAELLEDPYFVSAAENKPLPETAENMAEYAESFGGSDAGSAAGTMYDFSFGSTIDSNASTFLSARTADGGTISEPKGEDSLLSQKSADSSIGHSSKKSAGTMSSASTSQSVASHAPSSSSAVSAPSTVAKRGKGVVDPASGMQDKCHIFRNSDGRLLKCMLNQVDIAANNNKYYVIQMLESNEGGEYYLFTRWGRVGGAGKTKLDQLKSVHTAKSHFFKKFLEKTQNDWHSLPHFEKIVGKYQFIDIDEGEEEDDDAEEEARVDNGDVVEVPQCEEEPSTSEVSSPAASPGPQSPPSATRRAARSLESDSVQSTASSVSSTAQPTPASTAEVPAELQEMIHVLRNEDKKNALLVELDIDTSRMPLGRLSKKQIRDAAEVLGDIETEIKKKSPDTATLSELSSEFYTLIPHNVPRRKTPPVINTAAMVRQKMELLETLANVEAASKLMQKMKAKKSSPASSSAASVRKHLDVASAQPAISNDSLDVPTVTTRRSTRSRASADA